MGFSQKIDSTTFMKLRNKEYLIYKNSKNQMLGCAMNLECRSIVFIFYGIDIDQKARKIKIKGRALEHIEGSDSVGAVNVNIYLARSVNDKLIKIRSLGLTHSGSQKPIKDHFSGRLGDFVINTSFSPKDRLYFDGVSYDPVEFFIGKLLINN